MPIRQGHFTKKFDKRGVMQMKQDASKSTEWLRDQVVKLAHGEMQVKQVPSSKRYTKQGDYHSNVLRLGSMYFFIYDPKHKATLPYYDKFPLIFPVRYYNDGFLGMNLHYLPPVYRIKVLDQLYDIFEDRGMTDVKKYKLTASMINGLSSIEELKPCIKRYLGPHVQSLFMPVPPEDWHYSVLLSAENFEKASKSKVWSDSLAMIGK